LLFIALFTFILAAVSGCGGDSASTTDASGQTAAQAPAAQADMGSDSSRAGSSTLDPDPPKQPVRLVFIHHSVGEDWLDDSKGGLGKALRANNYFVSDTNYGWGPADADTGSENIGDHTDIGYWYDWFVGPNSQTYMAALFAEGGQNTSASYARLAGDPGGENEVVVFKSCFPNSNLGGSPNDAAATGQNLLRGQPAGEDVHTVQNAKGIYNDLLGYFRTRQDKLFVVVTAPPLMEAETSPESAANARAFNRWLVNDWLDGYPYKNVAVFDFYDVLTSNGGSATVSDQGKASGNHHRYAEDSGTIEYITGQGSDFAAYATDDSHPSAAGLQKAAAEFVPLLNISYNAWKGD